MSTMHDVAQRAGVSPKTVSRVVNGESGVSERTRRKVDAAIAELDFRPNPIARNLRTGRTGLVGLALPHLSQPFYAELAEAIMREAERHDLTVLTELTGGVAEAELALVSEHGPVPGGLLMYPVGLSDEQARSVARTVPTVFMSERAYEAPVDRVAMANREGVRAMVSHMASLGLHADRRPRRRPRRTARAGRGPPAPGRLPGRAARRAACPTCPNSSARWAPPTGTGSTGGGDTRLIERGVPFDALVAFADALALGALHAVQEADLTIPDRWPSQVSTTSTTHATPVRRSPPSPPARRRSPARHCPC